jgi:Leucine-rich repeat (LRR) protein
MYNNDQQPFRKASRTDNPQIISTFLDQLTFVDQSNKINSRFDFASYYNADLICSFSRDPQLTAMERLKSLDLLGSLRPTQPCRLDWHNSDLHQLSVQFLQSACLRLNPRVRNHKLVLTAITRLDLSDNMLQSLPPEVFQLPSLRTLNLDRNQLEELPVPAGMARSVEGCPCLETLSAESNRLTMLPDSVSLNKTFTINLFL